MIETEEQYNKAYQAVCDHILRGTDELPECYELNNQIVEYQDAETGTVMTSKTQLKRFASQQGEVIMSGPTPRTDAETRMTPGYEDGDRSAPAFEGALQAMSQCCVLCGQPWGTHGTACRPRQQIGTTIGDSTHFTPYVLTEADIRRIVREELERAKAKP